MNPLINNEIRDDLQKFGVKEWNDCFHCGNCTAICKLTEEGYLFPRKVIKQVQLGLKESLSANLDPWLCYYCGECSETCPRDANPAEIMMSLRRYLTSVYDWTGLSKKFYTSHFWELIFVSAIFLLVVAAFFIFLPLSPDVFTNAAAFLNEQGGVMINSLVAGMDSKTFVHVIELSDWTMAVFVGGLLITNIFNMYIKTIIRDKRIKVSLFSYIREFWNLIFNFITQIKFSKCDHKKYWLGHFLLMSGYTIMFILVVGLLPLFQTEAVYPWYNWQRLLGYYATFGILYFLIIATIERIRKKDFKFRYSHSTDWLFIVMLGLTTVSGILVHIFRLSGLPVSTYYSYMIHMSLLVPMIMIEVPFSKWSHLAYRPFAIYFYRLKKTAKVITKKDDIRVAA